MDDHSDLPHGLAARMRTPADQGDGERPSPAEGLKLTAAFMRVRSRASRRYLVALAERLADAVDGPEGASASRMPDRRARQL